MDNAAQKVKDWWEVADRTQRMVTIFGAGALVVLLVLTAYVMSQPRMTLLTSGLEPTDQKAAIAELQAAGIPVELDIQNSLRVPSNKVQEAQMILGDIGITAAGGSDPFKIMFDSNMFEGTAKEQQRARFAKQAALETTITSWQGVSAAAVHLNLEEAGMFAGSDGANNSSATVSITESGAGFGMAGGKNTAKLVQNATGIPAQNISVMNSQGQMLYQGDLLNQSGTASGQKLQTEIQEAKRRERDLRNSLDLAFGPGNTIAMIQVELDMDLIEESNITSVRNPDPYKLSIKSEDFNGSNEASGGAVGAMSNQAGAPTTSSSSSSTDPGKYTGDIKEELYDRDTKQSTLVKAPGALLAMTVQVVVNSAKVTDTKAVESIANAYLGSNLGEAGFVASVTSVEFDTEAAAAIATAADAMKGSATMQQIISLLPVIALIIVGFLVIRAISKVAAKNKPVYALAPAGAQQLTQQIPVAPVQQMPQALQHEAFQDMPIPETEAGQALASAIEGGDMTDALKIIEEMPEDDEIKAIRARINVPLEQIKHMAKTKPESVAMLLKGWMMEDMR